MNYISDKDHGVDSGDRNKAEITLDQMRKFVLDRLKVGEEFTISIPTKGDEPREHTYRVLEFLQFFARFVEIKTRRYGSTYEIPTSFTYQDLYAYLNGEQLVTSSYGHGNIGRLI